MHLPYLAVAAFAVLALAAPLPAGGDGPVLTPAELERELAIAEAYERHDQGLVNSLSEVQDMQTRLRGMDGAEGSLAQNQEFVDLQVRMNQRASQATSDWQAAKARLQEWYRKNPAFDDSKMDPETTAKIQERAPIELDFKTAENNMLTYSDGKRQLENALRPRPISYKDVSTQDIEKARNNLKNAQEDVQTLKNKLKVARGEAIDTAERQPAESVTPLEPTEGPVTEAASGDHQVDAKTLESGSGEHPSGLEGFSDAVRIAGHK